LALLVAGETKIGLKLANVAFIGGVFRVFEYVPGVSKPCLHTHSPH